MDMVLKFKRLDEEKALKLEVPFSMEEIKKAVWSCDESKASGSNGFNLYFFRKCWKIVQKNLFEMMVEFYQTGKLERSINSTFIAFIPKNENPNDIFEYKQIYKVSSFYKIVVRVLSRRLCEVIRVMVSDTQCIFIRGRQIYNEILITNEIINSVKKKTGAREI